MPPHDVLFYRLNLRLSLPFDLNLMRSGDLHLVFIGLVLLLDLHFSYCFYLKGIQIVGGVVGNDLGINMSVSIWLISHP